MKFSIYFSLPIALLIVSPAYAEETCQSAVEVVRGKGSTPINYEQAGDYADCIRNAALVLSHAESESKSNLERKVAEYVEAQRNTCQNDKGGSFRSTLGDVHLTDRGLDCSDYLPEFQNEQPDNSIGSAISVRAVKTSCCFEYDCSTSKSEF